MGDYAMFAQSSQELSRNRRLRRLLGQTTVFTVAMIPDEI